MRILIAALSLAMALPAAAQAPDPARATVQSLDDGLLAIMKAGSGAGLAGRSSRIAPVVDAAFDLPLMTRLTIGEKWSTLAPADQAALAAAFRRLTIAQYARNFDGFSGEAFAIARRRSRHAAGTSSSARR